jgi:hypothetical protein
LTYHRSIVVHHLQTYFKDAHVAVLCLYCNYKEQATQTVSNLISSLLKQIVQEGPVISDNIKSFYKHHQVRNTHPTIEELTIALEWEIGTYHKTFIIVDALDECSEDNGTRANLLQSLRSLHGTVNLMVTSRDLLSIARQFTETKRLDIVADDQDVRRYILSRIASMPRQHLIVLQDTIVNTIVANVGGM